MICTGCGIEFRVDNFRLAENLGDCWPVCSSCRTQRGRLVSTGRNTLQRKLYAAGRSISSCDACKREAELELHFILPAVRGGRSESRNLLVLCPACHDQVHAGARIKPRKIVAIKKRS
ncbi:MAG TPA: HNH endonuclease signature motif containing protein [Candidatus Glassbacteria bacterium]|nr:HNH endonuclease signature motif containing protein [Candidatus Glassbacteria bacterium]